MQIFDKRRVKEIIVLRTNFEIRKTSIDFDLRIFTRDVGIEPKRRRVVKRINKLIHY
jgi:hypothetical protein